MDKLFEELMLNIENGESDESLNNNFIIEISSCDDTVKQQYANRLLSKLGRGEGLDIWIYSFILAFYKNADILKQFILFTKKSTVIPYEIKYFLFQQIGVLSFLNPSLNTNEIGKYQWELLETILYECLNELNLNFTPIPASERNTGISLVLVEQYLTTMHGPTKTVLDRCYVMNKMFKQSVMLVNTAEFSRKDSPVSYVNPFLYNYIEQYLNLSKVEWKGLEFDFYQFERNMPTTNGIKELIGLVYTLKPASIILVGGTSLVAGVLNKIIPVITVATNQSGITASLTDYQIIDNNKLDVSYELLDLLGKSHDMIIPGRFTFSLKPQTHHYKREDFGLSESDFAIPLIGTRLNVEITDDFLRMISEIDDDNVKFVILGRCVDYDEKIKKHPELKNRFINLGFVEDILAVLEHFDLYVNPIRRGGGTSVVEAMSKGLPAVTVNYGDVAGIVPNEFHCEDLSEMKNLILKYKEDKDFYNSMSLIALKCAKKYLDSDMEFTRIMKIYFEKQGFNITDN